MPTIIITAKESILKNIIDKTALCEDLVKAVLDWNNELTADKVNIVMNPALLCVTEGKSSVLVIIKMFDTGKEYKFSRKQLCTEVAAISKRYISRNADPIYYKVSTESTKWDEEGFVILK